MYLFRFIIILNPVFNCSKCFISFSFDKVTTGTYNFLSVILYFVPDGAATAGLPSCAGFAVISAKASFLDQVKINSTSQLISGIFKLLQKLFNCLSGITTFIFVNESLSSGVFPTMLVLYLKDSESEERESLGSSL